MTESVAPSVAPSAVQDTAHALVAAAAAARPTPTEQEVTDGRFAYAAYATPSGAGDTTWDGRKMPRWDDLGDQQRRGWIAVGRAFTAQLA